MAKKVEKMSLGELVVERERLAAERTALRLRQVEVEEMIAFREVTVGLPPDLAKRIHLEGRVESAGGAS